MTPARGARVEHFRGSLAVGRFLGLGHRAWMRKRAQGLIEEWHWLGNPVSPGAA
jgi:hypothetical protein